MSKSIHGTNSVAPPPSIGARRVVAEFDDPGAPTFCDVCGAVLGRFGSPLVAVYFETPAGDLRCCGDCPGCLCA